METIENPVIGEKITFLMTSEQSNGSKSVMEVYLSPTGGNPLHYHKRFSETFSIIDGMLNVQIGKQVQTLHPNDSATAPINTVHRFYNTSGKPAARNGMPKSLWHMAVLMNMGEGYFVGFFSVFEKFLRFLTKTNKAKRIEKELLDKYCK